MKNYKIQTTADSVMTRKGYLIDEFDTLQEAKNMLANYESQDKQDGHYTPDFYEIVQQKMIVKSNAKKMTFTILKDGQSYNISAFSQSSFQRLQYNTESDWVNYLNHTTL